METFFNYIFAVMQPFSKDGWQILSLVSLFFLYKNWQIWKKDKIVISILLFLAYSAVLTLFSPDKAYSFKFLSKYFVGFGFSFLLGYSLNNEQHKEKIIDVYALVFAFTVILGFISYLGFISHRIGNHTFVELNRLCVFDWATGFAGRCEFVIMMFVTLFLFEEKKKYKYLILFSIFGVALILSKTRECYIATLCSFILLLFTNIYIKKFTKKQLLLLVVIAFFVGITVSSFIKSDEITVSDFIRKNSIVNRIEMYKMSISLIKEKPIFGHTPAVAAKPLYDMLSMNGPINKIEHFHNIYLNTLVDFGIIGFLLFIFIFYSLFCRLIKKYKETKSSYVLMLVFAWTAVLISDCFDALLINPFCSGMFFWITGVVLSEQKDKIKKSKKVAIFLNIGIGDFVWGTSVIPVIKSFDKDIRIILFTRKITACLADKKDFYKIVKLNPGRFKTKRKLKRYFYKWLFTVSNFFLLYRADSVVFFDDTPIVPKIAKSVFKIKNIYGPDIKCFGYDLKNPDAVDYSNVICMPKNMEQFHCMMRYQFIARKVFPSYNLSLPKLKDTSYLYPKIQNLISTDKKYKIMLCTKGSSYWKYWPADYFIKLIEMISSQYDAAFFVVGKSNEQKETADVIKNKLPDVDIRNLCNKTTLLELKEIIKNMNLLISVDTFAIHIAATYNVPTISFHGQSLAERTMPVSYNAIPMCSYRDCSPCNVAVHVNNYYCKEPKCMKDITPDKVFENVKRILK